MKKFIKFILVLGLLLLPCFSSAFSVGKIVGSVTVNRGYQTTISSNYTSNLTCIWTTNSACNWIQGGISGNPYSNLVCNMHGSSFTFTNGSNTSCTYSYIQTNLSDFKSNICDACSPQYTSAECQSVYGLITQSNCNTQYSGYITQNSCDLQYSGYILPSDCPSSDPMTSLECQSEYDLIPTSEITSNYCKLNFDLISPFECPSGGGCSGSGESIVFSNVYVNNVLYPGGADIYLNVNELLATEISYNSQLMYIDVDYDGDQDYINGIIDINTYQPTSNDFTQIFVGGLVRLFPYIVIALFIAFVRKLIRKIFK